MTNRSQRSAIGDLQPSIVNQQSAVVNRHEWHWAAAVGAVVLVAASLPYLLGWLNTSPERVFTGSFFMQKDAFSYLSKMRLGVQGDWLYHNVYAVEQHRRALLFVPYIAAGHLAGLMGGTRASVGLLIAIFHFWRLLGAVLLMWALYRFYAMLLPTTSHRRLAYLLSLVGGGLGGLAVLLGYGIIDGYRSIDLYLGEAYGFIALFALPHVLTARACALLALMRLAPSIEDQRSRWQDLLAVGAYWLIMTLCVPFYLLVAAAVVGMWLVLRIVRTHTIPWKGIVWAAIAGLPAALANLVAYLMMRGDAVYDSWNAQNSLPAVPVWNFALAFGLPVLLASVGGWIAWRARGPLAELCVGWIVAAAALVMVPLNVQLRLIEGAYIPLWGLAVAGLSWLMAGIHRRWGRRLLLGSFVAISLLTSAFLILGGSAVSSSGGEGIFVSGNLDAVLEWLNQNVPAGSVLLASEPVGVYAPARAGVRSVIGHGFETPDFDRKQAEVKAFYSGDMPDRQRLALLERYHVDYVLSGPVDRQWACSAEACAESMANLDTLPLRIVYRQGDVILYQAAGE